MPLIEVTPPIGIGLPVAFWPVFSPQSGFANAGAVPSHSPSTSAPAKNARMRFIASSLVSFFGSAFLNCFFGLLDAPFLAIHHDPKLRFYVRKSSAVNQCLSIGALCGDVGGVPSYCILVHRCPAHQHRPRAPALLRRPSP